MSEHDPCEAQTPEHELQVARQAGEMDDFKHAMSHLAGALAHDPTWEEAHELLEALLARCFVDPLETVPLEEDGPTYFGTVALRAWVLDREGEHGLALDLLSQVIASQGRADYLAWVEDWVGRPGWLESLPPRALTSLTRCAYGELGPAGHARLAAVFERLREVHPNVEMLAYGLLLARRKSGDAQGAVTLGEQLTEELPCSLVFLGLAAARREAGDLAGAVAANRQALEHPHQDEVGPRLDIGDLCLELERYGEATEAYVAVLEHAPDEAWALASLPYVELKRDQDPSGVKRLIELARAGNRRAASLLEEILPHGFPPSSVLDGVMHALQQGLVLTRSACSSLEPPSALLACRRALAELGEVESPELEVRFGEVPEPDPRVPWGEVAHGPLWSYEGTVATPAVEPPPAEVLAAVAAATREKKRPALEGTPAEVIDLLLRCMAHPPATPGDHHPAWWIYAIQAGCGSAIGYVDADWENVRLPALRSLLRGPVDWTTAVAVRTLDGVARREPALADAIDAELLALVDRPLNPIWFQCAVQPVASCLLSREVLPSRAKDLLGLVVGAAS